MGGGEVVFLSLLFFLFIVLPCDPRLLFKHKNSNTLLGFFLYCGIALGSKLKYLLRVEKCEQTLSKLEMSFAVT